MEMGEAKLRRNPRGVWYENVEKVTSDGDFQVTFHLKQPQPSLLALLSAGWSAIYPVTSRRRRCGDTRSEPGPSSSLR
jgi:MarR-like DNA-binding transcriptional regulator SgrR of sgrS sRNA